MPLMLPVYRKWRQLDRQLRHGAKGIFIFAPILLKDTAETLCQDEKHSNELVGFRGFMCSMSQILTVSRFQSLARPREILLAMPRG
jgi:hypothetical protein